MPQSSREWPDCTLKSASLHGFSHPWLDQQKADGYTFHASVGNVADWDSTGADFSVNGGLHMC